MSKDGYMPHYVMNTLSRLALLKAADNVGKRFKKAKKSLKPYGKKWHDVAKAIEKGDETNSLARAFMEGARKW